MELSILLITALASGFIHTILGPDHYLPFISLAAARKWTRGKTLAVTLLCGAGHVLSSIIIAVAGVMLGKSILSIKAIESFRGNIAGWLLLIFGFTYLVYGIFSAIKNKPHVHVHAHDDGSLHTHTHTHTDAHAHPHGKAGLTPWVLFIIFIFGPCEPMIPLIMYPVARGNVMEAVSVSLVFSFATIATIVGITMLALAGVKKINFAPLERYSHVIAGSIIVFAGAGIQFLGL